MDLPSIVPPPHGRAWPEATADAAGLNWMWPEEAARFGSENETAWPYDLRLQLESGFFEAPPLNALLGPIRPRGPANGLVLRRGFKVATRGDTEPVDFTFSAAKSYLSLLAGIAVMVGLTDDLDEPIGRTVDDGGFDRGQGGRRILPAEWIAPSVRPCALKSACGLLWWRRSRYKRAPKGSIFASGAGGNLTRGAPRQEIVAMLRWTDLRALDTFIRLIMQAVQE
jgi:hypothetical protein